VPLFLIVVAVGSEELVAVEVALVVVVEAPFAVDVAAAARVLRVVVEVLLDPPPHPANATTAASAANK
jgi:hypothetical protein